MDDDPFVLTLLGLELDDVHLVEASGIEEGFERALASPPDAVLLDLRLPDGDGRTLLARLRRDQRFSRTPVMVLTAGHDEADRLDLLAAGADEYLAKPFDEADLLARLHRLLDLDPDELRHRRHLLMDRLEAGGRGDPDPPAPPDDPPGRRWSRHRR